MLEELHIAGLGIFEEATLELAPGLNVLTGETGAGKTMITVGLGLVLGARTAPGLVRRGSGRLAVEARFRAPEDVVAQDRDLASWVEDGELILARSISGEGRSGARVGGRLAPAGTLAAIGARLVEVHGQHQAERLASVVAQTEFLDRFAGPEHQATLREHHRVHAELSRIRSELDALERDAREREREKDLLAYQVREIEAAAIEAGEREVLAAEESRLAHAERLLEVAAGAEAALGEEGGAADRVALAAEAGRAMVELDPAAAGLASRLESVAAEVADAVDDLRRYRDTVDVDPGRLDEVRQRIQAIRALERKYGDGEGAVLSFADEARARLKGLQDDEGGRATMAERIVALSAERDRLAHAIRAARRRHAPTLSVALREELEALGMTGAGLEVTLTDLPEPGPLGTERAEFVFAAGPAQEPMPLARVASGGELSRTMLACRSVLADLDDIPTLVFDEVDAGIGGRAAAAVGRRLAALAGHRQVVVVTHLAQIAARADRHFVVTKRAGRASVEVVDGPEREAELARMLSGTVGDVSLAHARHLLDEERPPARVGSGAGS